MSGTIVLKNICILNVAFPRIVIVKFRFFLHQRDEEFNTENITRNRKKEEEEIYYEDEFRYHVCLEKYFDDPDDPSSKGGGNLHALLGISSADEDEHSFRPSVESMRRKGQRRRKKKPDFPKLEILVSSKKRFGEDVLGEQVFRREFLDIYDCFGPMTFDLPLEQGEPGEVISFDIEYESVAKVERKEAYEAEVERLRVEEEANLKLAYASLASNPASLLALFSAMTVDQFTRSRAVCPLWRDTLDSFLAYHRDYIHARDVLSLLRASLTSSIRPKEIETIESRLDENDESSRVHRGFDRFARNTILNRRKQQVGGGGLSLYRLPSQHLEVKFRNPMVLGRVVLETELAIEIRDSFPTGNVLIRYEPSDEVKYQAKDFETMIEEPLSSLYLKFSNPLNLKKCTKFEILLLGFSQETLREMEKCICLREYLLHTDPLVHLDAVTIFSLLYNRALRIPIDARIMEDGNWFYSSEMEICSTSWKNLFALLADQTDEKRVNQIVDTIVFLRTNESNCETFEEAGGFEEFFRIFDELKNSVRLSGTTFKRFVDEFSEFNQQSLFLLSILKAATVARGPAEFRKSAEHRIVHSISGLPVQLDDILDACLPMIRISVNSDSVMSAMDRVRDLLLPQDQLLDNSILACYLEVIGEDSNDRELDNAVVQRMVDYFVKLYQKGSKVERIALLSYLVDLFVETDDDDETKLDVAVGNVLEELVDEVPEAMDLLLETCHHRPNFSALVAALGEDFMLQIVENYDRLERPNSEQREDVLKILEEYIPEHCFDEGEDEARFQSLLLLLKMNVIYDRVNERGDMRVRQLTNHILKKKGDVMYGVRLMGKVARRYYCRQKEYEIVDDEINGIMTRKQLRAIEERRRRREEEDSDEEEEEEGGDEEEAEGEGEDAAEENETGEEEEPPEPSTEEAAGEQTEEEGETSGEVETAEETGEEEEGDDDEGAVALVEEDGQAVEGVVSDPSEE